MKEARAFLLPLFLAASLIVVTLAVKTRQELRQKAAPATALTFSSPALTVKPGDTFTMDVVVATGDNTISAADVSISFDKDKLQAKSIVAGDFLTTVLVAGAVTDTKATITVGSPPTSPKKGNGKLATLTFQAKTEGETRISFDEATQIAGIGEQGNVVIGKTPATVTIRQQGGSQSTPTPTPTIRQNSTPTPIKISQKTPSSSPSPTPTQKSSANRISPSPTVSPKPPSPTPNPTNPMYYSAFGGLMRGSENNSSPQSRSHTNIPEAITINQPPKPPFESNVFTTIVMKVMEFIDRLTGK